MGSMDPIAADVTRADVERLAAQLDAALARLGAGEAGADWRLRARLLRLEAEYLTAHQPVQAPSAPPWHKRILGGLLDVLERLSPIATPIVIALFAFLLTGTTQEFLELRKVTLAEQELDLETTQAIGALLVEFRKQNINRDTAERLANQIAYFGHRTIVPLVSELRTARTTDDPQAKAIKGALQILALYPDPQSRLCTVLAEVSSGTSASAFSEPGRAVASEVLNAIACEGGSQ